MLQRSLNTHTFINSIPCQPSDRSKPATEDKYPEYIHRFLHVYQIVVIIASVVHRFSGRLAQLISQIAFRICGIIGQCVLK
jgi:hypothetical protein